MASNFFQLNAKKSEVVRTAADSIVSSIATCIRPLFQSSCRNVGVTVDQSVPFDLRLESCFSTSDILPGSSLQQDR